MLRLLISKLFVTILCGTSLFAVGQETVLSNGLVEARFGDHGLSVISTEPLAGWNQTVKLRSDSWSIEVDGAKLDGGDRMKQVVATKSEVTYVEDKAGYLIELRYELKPGWMFVTKTIRLLRTPSKEFQVLKVTPLNIRFDQPVLGMNIPTGYAAQTREDPDNKYRSIPTKDYGAFIHMSTHAGVMLITQNPFLSIERNEENVRIDYSSTLNWNVDWGPFTTDVSCIGLYRLTGETIPSRMIPEWKLHPDELAKDGLDRGEIESFRDCVSHFLINPPSEPNSVEVGWTLNDYQIDVGTPLGQVEYKHIIDMTSELGIKTLLYAPSNSAISDRANDHDSWQWEHTLWLSLGQKISRGEWNPSASPIPKSVTDMVSYAKGKKVGLLAYVYPSIPFSQSRDWIVENDPKYPKGLRYSNLASRHFQDLLIGELISFKRRTGIAGYSFDYTFLDFSNSSVYAQWYGWRRVLEELKKAEPDTIIDGRQSYQLYGPWTWLAGSYPHPTGGDEQPESFKPFPDLHLDRVSGDRARFVNYWYRNFQYAPAEIIPGFATHQTERLQNVNETVATGVEEPKAILVQSGYRRRDWDLLGYQYSFLSSIATGGWNNLVSMIPARDPEERKHFSNIDKQWIRTWIKWTADHREYLRATKTILSQPQRGKLDGTAACLKDRGFIFIFNPNYQKLRSSFILNETVGLSQGASFIIKEVYPNKGRLWGKSQAGLWLRGDSVAFEAEGTSATVLEIIPANNQITGVFNSAVLPGQSPTAHLLNEVLYLSHVAGEPGSRREIGVIFPDAKRIKMFSINGRPVFFKRYGDYLSSNITFGGNSFSRAQEIKMRRSPDGSLMGVFKVPNWVFQQLSERKRYWPIPWTKEDLKTTWLAPERLLLFIQSNELSDDIKVRASVDGVDWPTLHAYTSTRVHPASFTGVYADFSKIRPKAEHTLRIHVDTNHVGSISGVFFDNIEPYFTSNFVLSN